MTAGLGPPHRDGATGSRLPRSTTLPPPDQVLRGLALCGLSFGLFRAAGKLAWRTGFLGWPPAGALCVGAFLAAWAAIIHLTGGERFDDHPEL